MTIITIIPNSNALPKLAKLSHTFGRKCQGILFSWSLRLYRCFGPPHLLATLTMCNRQPSHTHTQAHACTRARASLSLIVSARTRARGPQRSPEGGGALIRALSCKLLHISQARARPRSVACWMGPVGEFVVLLAGGRARAQLRPLQLGRAAYQLICAALARARPTEHNQQAHARALICIHRDAL